MSSEKDLQERIAKLMRAADARVASRRGAREELMELICDRKDRFEAVVRRLLDTIASPRLEVLARSFANSGSVVPLKGGHGLAVPFSHTDEVPAHARVEVSFAHDPNYDAAWCSFATSIIPILMDYERDGSLDVTIESPDEARLVQFLDQRIERFVASYLSIREPDSFYQKELLVTDPICGMTFRRADAHSVLKQGGSEVFFCTDACRKQFEASSSVRGQVDGQAVRSAMEAERREGSFMPEE